MKRILLKAQIMASAFFVVSAISQSKATGNLPKPDHIVVVIEENHDYGDIVGSSSAPYINSLLNDTDGAQFTQSYAIEHPSQPNYLDLFSGSDQGQTSDNLPSQFPFTAPNMGYNLIKKGYSYTTYSEGLPSVGSNVATSGGNYARKHNPAANWMGTGTNDIPTTTNQPWTSFPTDFTTLPTVSYVIPNLNDDMHNGTIPEGDTWLKTNMAAYITWAKTHNSLFILTWDEDDDNGGPNQILTAFAGQMVKGAQYSEHINHYRVLRTIEDMYGLTYCDSDAMQTPITDCWRAATTTGISNVNENNVAVSVFPNPASSGINFVVSNIHTSPVYLTVSDVLGRTMERTELEQKQNLFVNTSEYANGMYLYTLTENNRPIKSGKFIVAH